MLASLVKVTLGLPPFASATSLLFHSVNNSMTLLISIILFQALPVFLVTLSSIRPLAVFAIIPQSVFAGSVLAKLTLVFPLFAFVTAFLLHAINGPMALLIYEAFFHRTPISPVISAYILTIALFAPIHQPIFVLTILTKLTLIFPLFTSTTTLFLNTIDNPMGLFVTVVFFHMPTVFPVISVAILTVALFAPIPQPIFVLMILTKLILAF